ncbi:MAG TPA: RNA-guided pseudouridylation complex pseudouridine synthase subunit Cbf5 [archaeon]|nr:RNA-guided pseudouridylation complex pseudouridine synthase subunit Cbf5 [archaeon]
MIEKSYEASLRGTYPGARKTEEHLRKGIIILDKPSGPTCHQIDAWVKQLLELNLASHGGTLDPRVSGVLVIALEKSTKLMPVLLSSRKQYVGLVNLHQEVAEWKIKEACKELVGTIEQLPPKRSAVARRVRERQIYSLDVLEAEGRNVLIRVDCEAGVYVRRLAEQIGDKLGVKAHLQELRRTKSGIFSEEDSVTMQRLVDAVSALKEGDDSLLRNIVHPLELLCDGMKVVVVKDSAMNNIRKGSPLYSSGVVRIDEGIVKGDTVGMLSLQGELIAIGFACTDSERIGENKVTVVRTDRVMQ